MINYLLIRNPNVQSFENEIRYNYNLFKFQKRTSTCIIQILDDTMTVSHTFELHC